jgi:hypothetical protein
MDILRSILLAAIASLGFLGCDRSPSGAPTTGFRLSVQEVVTDTDTRAARLTIHTAGETLLTVDEDGDPSSVVLHAPSESGSREGSIALVASRISPPGEGRVYIQTLIRLQTPDGTQAGGPTTQALPRATALTDHFKITAIGGDYSRNTPIEIARLAGKPVTLTVK